MPRTMRHAPKRCIFCGGGGVRGNPISKEHIWPEWMHPHLPKMEKAKNWSATVSVGLTPLTVQRNKSRLGHPFTKTLRVVCKTCNESWMGSIEQQAKAHFTKLFQPKPYLLDLQAKRTIAKWMALKTLVLEFDGDSSPVASIEMREAFRKHQTIPNGMKIWMAHHNHFEWACGYWGRGLVTSSIPNSHFMSLKKNVQTTAFGAGPLFFLVYFSTTSFELGLNPRVHDPKMIMPLWPPDNKEAHWPIPKTPRQTLALLANILDEWERAAFSEWRGPFGFKKPFS